MSSTNKSKEEVTEFYDKYVSKQQKTGINIRHRTILRNLKTAGLKRNSKVLEIGCGIGTLTGLVGKFCTDGRIVAVDISPESIETAKKINSDLKNIEWIVSDMKNFSRPEKFDFVVFPDVLEHIPLTDHKGLFATVKKHIHKNSTLAINIPDPYCLDWFRKNEPEKLQVIDQSLYTNLIIDNFYSNDFYLHSLQTYSLIIAEGDYQWLIVKPKKELTSIHKRPELSLKIQELKSRLIY